jgi:hypothetical protein
MIGIGYGLPWPEVLPFVPEGRQCFGAGAGGSLVIADADRHITFAYAMNKMAQGGIVGPIAAALAELNEIVIGNTKCKGALQVRHKISRSPESSGPGQRNRA